MSGPSGSTGHIGGMPEFDGDDWKLYEEQLDQYFEANNIGEDKRTAVLINVIRGETYKILRNLCHPVLPKDKSFNELCEMLRKRFNPQATVFQERVKFYSAQQSTDENVMTWYDRISSLAVNCKFGGDSEKNVLDKFIAGMQPGPVRDRLCEENETITLQAAVDIAVNKESSAIELIEDSDDDEANDAEDQDNRENLRRFRDSAFFRRLLSDDHFRHGHHGFGHGPHRGHGGPMHWGGRSPWEQSCHRGGTLNRTEGLPDRRDGLSDCRRDFSNWPGHFLHHHHEGSHHRHNGPHRHHGCSKDKNNCGTKDKGSKHHKSFEKHNKRDCGPWGFGRPHRFGSC